MKKLISLFLLFFTIVGCDYQEGALNLSGGKTRAVLASPNDIILEQPTNNLGLSKNFQLFLDRYLKLKTNETADTLFDYDKYRNERDHGKGLELRQNISTIIAKTDIKALENSVAIAFLINAYNFFAIEMISNNYFLPNGERLKSITSISPNGFSQQVFNVGGLANSLNQIEKETLVPLVSFDNGGVDARIHFAVICAANGCPFLMKEAYSADSIQEQLTKATIEGLKLKRNLDESAGTLTKLFDWYGADFNNHSEQGFTKVKDYKDFISKYTTDVDTSKLDRLRNNDYDWAINKVINESDEPGFYNNLQQFLDSYVQYINNSKDTLVDYDKLFAQKDQPQTLNLRTKIYSYLKNIDLSLLVKNEKVALLTNAYNFFAIEIAIKNYDNGRLESISDIGGRDSFSAFSSKEFNIGGKTLSLDDIEKGTLIPIVTSPNGSIDARVHFAVICAAKGCPILKKQVYIPSLIDLQLTSATVDSLREKRNFSLSPSKVNLTSLFNWYASDFSNHSTDGITITNSTEKFLELYIDGLMLESIGTPNYVEYDWKLNKL